jgi:hypothetical protein
MRLELPSFKVIDVGMGAHVPHKLSPPYLKIPIYSAFRDQGIIALVPQHPGRFHRSVQ